MHAIQKMAALLAVSVEEQQAVIKFLWSKGVKPHEIYRRMLWMLQQRTFVFLSLNFWDEDSRSYIILHLPLILLPLILIFGPLNNAWKGQRFASDEDEVKGAVHFWLKAQPNTFFISDGIKKCNENEGDYVDTYDISLKLHISKYSIWCFLKPPSIFFIYILTDNWMNPIIVQ